MQKDNQKVRMSFSEEYSAVLLRTEKITSAVYLLADFISSDETISKNLKDTASALATAILAEDDGWRVRSVLVARKIVFYTSIVAGVGYVSDRTNILLKSEVENLITRLSGFMNRFDDRSVRREEKYHTSENFEDTLTRLVLPDNREIIQKDSTLQSGSIKKFAPSPIKDILRTEKDTISYPISVPEQSVSGVRKDVPHISESTGDRKVAILNVLKRSDNLTVKDFSSYIHDCSEKTIQRDLAALVATGAVSRKGERRWTRYSLAGAPLR